MQKIPKKTQKKFGGSEKVRTFVVPLEKIGGIFNAHGVDEKRSLTRLKGKYKKQVPNKK